MLSTNSNSNAPLPVTLSQDLPGQTSTKTCIKCGESLPLSQFYKHATSKDGVRNECKACRIKNQNKYARSNPYKTILKDCRRRSREKGFDFDLDLEFLKSIDRVVCPYLLQPISHLNPDSSWSKSIDRIDSAKGYTKDNVIICSWRANRLLSDGSLSELSLLVHNFRRILLSTEPTNQ